jgi:hypothetical protein
VSPLACIAVGRRSPVDGSVTPLALQILTSLLTLRLTGLSKVGGQGIPFAVVPNGQFIAYYALRICRRSRGTASRLAEMALVAELEAGFISDRNKAAVATAKRRGKKLGGFRAGAKLTAKARQKGADANAEAAAARASDLAPVSLSCGRAALPHCGPSHALSTTVVAPRLGAASGLQRPSATCSPGFECCDSSGAQSYRLRSGFDREAR